MFRDYKERNTLTYYKLNDFIIFFQTNTRDNMNKMPEIGKGRNKGKGKAPKRKREEEIDEDDVSNIF